MSKSKRSRRKQQSDELVISLATLALGLIVLMFFVAADRPHWFIEGAGVSGSTPASAKFSRIEQATEASRPLALE
jgi:hypothetical protein